MGYNLKHKWESSSPPASSRTHESRIAKDNGYPQTASRRCRGIRRFPGFPSRSCVCKMEPQGSLTQLKARIPGVLKFSAMAYPIGAAWDMSASSQKRQRSSVGQVFQWITTMRLNCPPYVLKSMNATHESNITADQETDRSAASPSSFSNSKHANTGILQGIPCKKILSFKSRTLIREP